MVAPRHLPPPDVVRAPVSVSLVEVYRAHAPSVARWAARLGSADCDVEDAVQEVFLVVNRKLAKFPVEGNLTSWLFQITRRIVANQRRRLWWRRLSSGNQVLDGVYAEGQDLDLELERRRIVVLFHQALDRLPERQRTVFVLYELEGLSTPAIAELAQRNLATVKVQLARARQRFMASYQRLLRKHYGASGLAEIAGSVVKVVPPAASRLGRKTS